MRAVGGGSTRSWRAIYVNILLVFNIVLSSCGAGPLPATAIAASDTGAIQVIVKDQASGKEIEDDVIVLVQTTNPAQADDNVDGALRLQFCTPGQPIYAWSPNYYINHTECDGKIVYKIELQSLDATDNPNYSWIGAERNCATCHSTIPGRTEYLEWNKDGHSRVFIDSYFWNMYMGTDINQNLVGPGFRLDHPGENGNCANCHAPATVKALQQGMDLPTFISSSLGNPTNVEMEGVTCDVCHKVMDVLLSNNLRPFVDHPGVLSFSFQRPFPNQPFYIGPLLDPKLEDSQSTATCSPAFSESKFCAACHYGKFFDTVIYNSYGEWLESPYSQKGNTNYRSCQDCHMLSPGQIGDTLPSERSACSETNLNFRDFNHNMMKYGLDPDNNSQEIPLLVRDAASIGIDAITEQGKVNVKVTVTNTGAGHKFPTDSPLRHLILLVEARDENEMLLAQVGGPVIPLWGAEDYAGRAGVIYANILKEEHTNNMPTFAYWNLTEPAWQDSDTRLNPGIEVPSEYSFAAPSNGDATITAKLIYRYAFFEIARQKGWNRPDVLVTTACKKLKNSIESECQPKDK